MKKLLLFTLAACLTFSMAYAQVPHPELYNVVYGNPDGSPLTVGINRDIEVPCWGHVDPNDPADTIVTMLNPLKSANSIIPTRNGGFFPIWDPAHPENPAYVGGWDLHFFTNAVPNPYPGGTDSLSGAILGINDLGSDPPTFNPVNSFWFGDDQFHLIGTFRMHTANDPGLVGTTVCPFAAGMDPANGTLLWGLDDGIHDVVPTATYSCLSFPLNQPPIWDVFPAGTVDGTRGVAMSFPLAGHDPDPGDVVTITQTAGPGSFAAGTWSWPSPIVGDVTVSFLLADNNGGSTPLDVQLHVVYGDFGFTMPDPGVLNGNNLAPMTFNLTATDVVPGDNLTITKISGPGVYTPVHQGPGGIADGHWDWAVPVVGDDQVVFELNNNAVITNTAQFILNVHVEGAGQLSISCKTAFPGGEVFVPVNLYNLNPVGGFDIVNQYDPSVLTLLGVDFTTRDDMGHEYNNIHMEDYGPGTVRVVYLADVNNGTPHAPIDPYVNDSTIYFLHFRVASGDFLFGTHVVVDFMTNDFRDNTLSDPTGYIFYTLPLVAGCVDIASPDQFKGDPNMNGFFYEVADVVLVAQRLISGWGGPGLWPGWTIDPPVQESASDLNNNGFTDVSDLVRFINILNGYILPPKLDPTAGNAEVSLNGNTVSINSGLEVGAVLVNFDGEIGTVTTNSNMDVLSGNNSVLIYSIAGNRIAAGTNELFTISGNAAITHVSVSDAYGRLMNASKAAPIPTSFGLVQNYPNPFNAKTEIKFALPTASDVSINIYNVTGQVVQTISGHYDAGYQSVIWDASNVASGIYFYRLNAGEFSQTMKMTLLK